MKGCWGGFSVGLFVVLSLGMSGKLAAQEAALQPDVSATLFSGGPDSALASPAAATPTNLFSETFWSAFAGFDLTTLRHSAKSDAESRFAEAMTLLAGGNVETAESAFAAASQQRTDVNVAVASQADIHISSGPVEPHPCRATVGG